MLGYQPSEALPGIARRVDLWLAPYRQNELTEACCPLKVYEYLATGKPVVCKPLDGLAGCGEVVDLALGPDEVAAAVERRLADPAAGRDERLRRRQ